MGRDEVFECRRRPHRERQCERPVDAEELDRVPCGGGA
jgi:hypothetical protein